MTGDRHIYIPPDEWAEAKKAIDSHNERNGPPRLTLSRLVRRLLAEWSHKTRISADPNGSPDA